MVKVAVRFMLVGILTAFSSTAAWAHCEVPCGIFDDETRLKLLAEHIQTIEKSITEIRNLEKAKKPNHNQLVRWVVNKEDHAHYVRHIVVDYFLSQRVKPAKRSNKKAYASYQEMITLLHQMIVQSMKAKQSTDLAHVKNLNALLESFSKLYRQSR